jgi:hypothetical protein
MNVGAILANLEELWPVRNSGKEKNGASIEPVEVHFRNSDWPDFLQLSHTNETFVYSQPPKHPPVSGSLTLKTEAVCTSETLEHIYHMA